MLPFLLPFPSDVKILSCVKAVLVTKLLSSARTHFISADIPCHIFSASEKMM